MGVLFDRGICKRELCFGAEECFLYQYLRVSCRIENALQQRLFFTSFRGYDERSIVVFMSIYSFLGYAPGKECYGEIMGRLFTLSLYLLFIPKDDAERR